MGFNSGLKDLRFRTWAIISGDQLSSHVSVSKIQHFFSAHWSVHRNNIVVYKSQQDAHVTEFIFVLELLYMFQVSLSPIFRSTKQL
jgi:hypothetical protein